MGIRIHKVLGYALTDVKVKKYSIVDQRFNLDCPFINDRGSEGYEKLSSIRNYKAWLKKQPEDEFRENHWELMWVRDACKKDKTLKVDNCFFHQNEYGIPKVFLICPFSGYLGGWYRYDNIIDWVESSLAGKGPTNSVRKVHGGIYPYSGSYMDSKDGRRVDLIGQGPKFVKRLEENGQRAFAIEFVKKLGFENLDASYERVAPVIPEGVKFLCQYTQIFKDEATIRQLRPILYTYWS